jgi:PDZ domain-containing protein
MSRRTLTLAFAGFLVVLLAAVAALLPVPYVAISPGPVTNTLGAVGKTELIQISGHTTYPDRGQLDLTTISAFGGPSNRLDLVTALRGWLDDEVAVVPQEQIYPDGETAEQVEEQSAAEMSESQASATTAALRHLDIPVTVRLFVDGIAPSSKARGKLKKGDELVEVDGKKVSGGAELRATVTAHEPGDVVPLVVVRDGERMTVDVTTTEAPDGRTIIGITTRDEAEYPFTVKFGLEDVGGPSAGTMFALGIVDKLTPGSLTGGKHIAGTGTIDADGSVGPIGGIPQKMVGAKRAGATVFLAPADNCAEALRTKPDGLKLVKIKTLSGAVNALDKVREGRPGVPHC